jgi:hypothetical protein
MTEKCREESYWMYRETGRFKIGGRELYQGVNIQVYITDMSPSVKLTTFFHNGATLKC